MENPTKLFRLENGLILEKGDLVQIETDGTEFDEIIVGKIEGINECVIWVEGDEDIPYDYIIDVKMIESKVQCVEIDKIKLGF